MSKAFSPNGIAVVIAVAITILAGFSLWMLSDPVPVVVQTNPSATPSSVAPSIDVPRASVQPSIDPSSTLESPTDAVLRPIRQILHGDLLACYLTMDRRERIQLESKIALQLRSIDKHGEISYRSMMQMMTAPNAEEQIGRMWSAEVRKTKPGEVGRQIQQLAGMLVDAKGPLRRETKARIGSEGDPDGIIDGLGTAMAALGAWASTAPLHDPELSKKTASCVVRAMRIWGYPSMEEVQMATASEQIDRIGHALPILFEIFSIYGLSVEDMLLPRSCTSHDLKGDTALVSATWKFGEITINRTFRCRKIDGKWSIIDRVKESPNP